MNTALIKFVVPSLLFSLSLTFPSNLVLAQLLPDSTLGGENSTVKQLEVLKQQIEGGAIRGGNLFHSFLEFNVNNGQSVYFTNPNGVNNILTRVTGNNISQILGVLGVSGNANLFLLNPNGIFFGQNARLDLNGSFIATTGEIKLGENGVFSATNIQGSTLLNIPPEVIFTNAQNTIENRANLVVKDGKNLILIAKEIIEPDPLNKSISLLNIENARLKPDESLGTENTQIEAIDETNDRVTGGAKREINLFHSFQEFNVENGRGVYFANPVGVENILARVTGNNISEIRGTLGVEGNADLYFINPNGLFFNQNASLDLNGSFFASTAEAIIFDNFEYSAVNPNIPPDLVINAPTGLRIGENNGDIVLSNEINISQHLSNYTASSNNNIVDLIGDGNRQITSTTSSLILPSGQTLAFIGGNVNFDGMQLVSSGNNLILGSLNQGGIVNLNPDLTVTFPENITKGDINIVNGSLIDVSGNDGGSVTIDGKNINLNGGSGIFVGITTGGGFDGANSGGLILNASETVQIDNSLVFNFVDGLATGNSGKVIISGENILINGQSSIGNIVLGQGDNGGILINTANLYLLNGGQIFTRTDTEGNIEPITIKTTQDIFFEGEANNNSPSQIWTIVYGNNSQPNSDDILIETSNLALTNGGRIYTLTEGERNAGAINLNATQNILIDGEATDNSPSQISSTNILNLNGSGMTGDILIETYNLALTNGGQISTFTLGEENPKTIQINALNDILIDGTRINGTGSQIWSVVSTDQPMKKGSDILINTSNLALTNGGRIITSALQGGNAGTIEILANNDILVDGGENNKFPSDISSSADAQGNSSHVSIDTTNLALTNGGRISTANSSDTGNTGTIEIIAQGKILIDGEKTIDFGGGTVEVIPSSIINQISEDQSSGNTGEIIISTDSLDVTRGGQISTSTSGMSSAGTIKIFATGDILVEGETSTGFASFIASEIYGSNPRGSGNIIIETSNLSLAQGGRISASTDGEGNSGGILITTGGNITIDGEQSDGLSSDISTIVGPNAAGNSEGIMIDTTNLTLTNGGEISASTYGSGNAGQIHIKASGNIVIDGEKSDGLSSSISSEVFNERDLKVSSGGIVIETTNLSLTNGAEIDASTYGNGDAGVIQITAKGDILVDGERSRNPNLIFPSNISSAVYSQTENAPLGANSGGILIDTSNLTLTNGSRIDASTYGNGNAGAIVINVDGNIIVDGESKSGYSSWIASTVQESATGNSGGITIDTANLSITNGGSVSTLTNGEGDAGEINIYVKEDLNIEGKANNGVTSRISGRVAEKGRGNSGDILIDASNLTLRNGGEINALTEGVGDAGDININTGDNIMLNPDSKLIVETRNQGKAGNITIHSPSLTIGNNAELSARSTQLATGENAIAGDINLSVNQLNIAGELGIFAETNSEANAGNSTIQPHQTSPNLNIQFIDNGFISARTTNSGDGGSITINAPENIDIRGVGSITAATSSNGKAGNI